MASKLEHRMNTTLLETTLNLIRHVVNVSGGVRVWYGSRWMFDDGRLLDFPPLRNHLLPPCQRTNDSFIFPDSVNSRLSNLNTHIPKA